METNSIRKDRVMNAYTHVIVFAIIVAVTHFCVAGCDSEPAPDPDPGIDATVTQTGSDSGTTNTADAKVNTPDAQQNIDPCAAYADVPRDHWTCRGGGLPLASTLTPFVQGNSCIIDATQFTCQEAPPASTMLTGGFTCRDIGTQVIITCNWAGP